MKSRDALRIKAHSPGEAKRRHRHVLQQALACVCGTTQLYIGDSPLGPEGMVSLASNPLDARLVTANEIELFLRISQRLQVVEDHRYPGDFRLSTRAYYYGVRLSPDDESPVIAWHWDPSESQYPHPHVHTAVQDPQKRGVRLHIPTGRRVTLEQVLRFLIEELDVKPVQDSWDTILAEGQLRYDTFQVQDEFPSTPN